MGVDYLFFSLIDKFIDQYFNSLEFVDYRFAEIETNLIEQKNVKLDDLYQLRKDLHYLKKGAEPIKDILSSLIKTKNSFITDTVNKYFIDAQDDASHIFDSITSYREMMNSLYEANVAYRNDEINKKIMTLTIISVIFIPLSFLAGVFGMNFLHMPLLTYKFSFIIFMAFCVSIVIIMLLLFKRKKWF